MPVHSSYYKNLDSARFSFLKKILTDFSQKKKIPYFDYTNDPRFNLDDFTPKMVDHMNEKGAVKFSMILNKDVIIPMLHRTEIGVGN